MEAQELDSSITQPCYSCTTKDRLTGRMEIFKGVQTHTHTCTHKGAHTHLAQCIKSSVQPDCLCVVLCVLMCVFRLLGSAVDGADLLGKGEKKKGSGKAN